MTEDTSQAQGPELSVGLGRSMTMRKIDWNKVEKFIAERNPVEVSAGLLDDWFWTAATVYANGEWKDRGRAHVESWWATPGFKAKLPNGDVIEVVAILDEP